MPCRGQPRNLPNSPRNLSNFAAENCGPYTSESFKAEIGQLVSSVDSSHVHVIGENRTWCPRKLIFVCSVSRNCHFPIRCMLISPSILWKWSNHANKRQHHHFLKILTKNQCQKHVRKITLLNIFEQCFVNASCYYSHVKRCIAHTKSDSNSSLKNECTRPRRLQKLL